MAHRPTAQQLATALLSTTERYASGRIVKSTWQTHMTHLWARVDELRMRTAVRKVLGLK